MGSNKAIPRERNRKWLPEVLRLGIFRTFNLSSLLLWLMRKSIQRVTDCDFRNIMVSPISPIRKVIQWSS